LHHPRNVLRFGQFCFLIDIGQVYE
jgi:hypothetical protein